MSQNIDAILTIPYIQVENANLVSSPLTYGFPAVSAFLGAIHRLQREMKKSQNDETSYDLKFHGTAIICHGFNPQVSGSFEKSFCLTRNPVDKDGKSASIVEEGRTHLEVSLIVQVSGDDAIITKSKESIMLKKISEKLQSQRLAGGSIVSYGENKRQQLKLDSWPDDYEGQVKETKKIVKNIMPGFVLIGRNDLLVERTAELQKDNSEATALDALLDYSCLFCDPTSSDPEKTDVDWIWRKKVNKGGWIVPIPVGYGAISDLHQPGIVLNARNNNYPFQFVESVYSLGEWRSLHRFKHLNDIFWNYDTKINSGYYLCINKKTDTAQ